MVVGSSDAQPEVGGTTEFWLVPLPRGTPRAVPALGGSREHHPYPFAWMPDGRRIVLGTDRLSRTPGMHLWMADLEAGTLRPLTATSGSETYPAVSPDGRTIAFTSQDEDYHLVEIPLAASGALRTDDTASRMEADPAWSPQGGQYAFVTDRSGSPEIWLRSRDAAFERPLVTGDSFKDGRGTAMFSSPSFSPDGQRLAYQRATAGSRFSLWVSTVAGGPPVEIPSVPDSAYQDFPSWSPDGTWVSFIYMARGKWGLAKVRPGGGEKPVVVKEGIVYPSGPRWSPRGDWITCDTPEGFSLVSPDGQTARVLSDETWLAHGWSKDGTTVYAVRQTDQLHMQLTSFDVRTGAEKIMAADLGPTPPTSIPLRGFSLAADGRSFLTSVVRLKGDVWLLEGFATPSGPFDRLLRPHAAAVSTAR
jgi:dipeptidyl aminopeptidase/acylaminoacyl peptidase